MPRAKRAPVEVSNALNRSWGWLLALGLLFVILGGLGLWMVVGLTLVSVLFIGVLLLIAGVSQLIDVFGSKKWQWKGMTRHAIIAVLYLICGGVFIYDPILASTFITALIAWVLIIIGIVRISMAFALRDLSGWAWLLLGGLTAIVLGVLILIQWPYSGLWVLGLFIAIELMVTGWTYIFMSLALKQN